MDERTSTSTQHLADKHKVYQAACRVYLEIQRDVQEGRLRPEILEEEWPKVEEAAAEVADARWDYEEMLAEG